MAAERLKKLPANRPVTKLPMGGLTANMLRLLAIVLMVSDHTWAAFGSLGDWMTHIGRLAFPIFAFQLAEGFVHTKNRKKYALRLGIFALISEILFDMAFYKTIFYTQHQNIFFTLLFGVLSVFALNGGGLSAAVCCLLSILAQFLRFDYGGAGVLLIIVFALCEDRYTAAVVTVFSLLLTVGGGNLANLGGLMAIPLIKFYNEKRGGEQLGIWRKWIFYFYYPSHIALIFVFSSIFDTAFQ